MTDIVGKSLTSFVGTSVKPLTNIVLNKLKFNKAINRYKTIFENNKDLSESVIENVITTIVCTFDKNSKETIEKLLSTTDNHQEFIDYLLLNAQCYESSFDKHSEECSMFNKIIECLVEDMFLNENLSKLITCLTDNELYIQIFKGQNQIINLLYKLKNSNNQMSEMTNIINKLIEAINQINQDSTLPTENKIHDDNEEYKGQYKDNLFLEANFSGDDNVANLESVYVEPQCTGSSLLSDKLKSWRNQSKEKLNKRTKVLLLYGKAGMGKSSLTSYIIVKKILGEECHALVLRKNENINLLNHRNAWESVKQCFKCDDDNTYKNKVLILDGLDEVCVLKKDFNGKLFVENLRDVSPRGVKILITSRNHEGYFEEIKPDNNLEIENIVWTSAEINQWCEKYCEVHKNNLRIDNWCKNFIKQYKALASEDKRKDIFCTPIILYICCVKEIDISKHDSVAGIYDEAFHYIGNREHGKTGRTNDLKENDEEQFKINWQYTKELAFQMFLNNSLESALSGTFVKKAYERTAELMEKENTEIKPQLAKYFAVFHFVSKNNEGIEFAHKTVGEYFTAVKIYEDYINNIGIESTPHEAWENIFQAFRYNEIPKDIMNYLFELIKIRLDIDLENWRNKFFENYYIGMDEQLLWKMTNQETYYQSVDDYIITEQVAVSFRNLTWLLSLLGFNNNEERDYIMYLTIFSSLFQRNFIMDINCYNWNNLNYVNLMGANLKGAQLTGADLSGANLSGANLSNADLSGADLGKAKLSVADLSGANLSGANLNEANIDGVHLNGINYLDRIFRKRSYYQGSSFDSVTLNEMELNKILLYEQDLPKFDEYIEKCDVKLIEPIVICVPEHEGYVYDPKTNRMIPPGDKIESKDRNIRQWQFN